MRSTPPLLASHVLVGTLVVAIAVLGLTLRLEGPLSSPALGAEDPYTHIVFTKEALDHGYFGDSFHLGTTMYPPAIHAFAGIVAPLAGVSLYDFARFLPPALGALAVVGMFLLANRLAGPAAGVAAALVTAVMPEHVFRTELFFPTAFDLALLPAWMLAFDVALSSDPTRRARIAAGSLFLVMSVAIAFLHPWAVPLFAAPLALFAALRIARTSATKGDARRDLAFAAALLVLSTAFAMASRWRQSDTGFADFFAHLGPLALLSTLDLPPPALFVALVALFGMVAAAGLWAFAAIVPALRRVTTRIPALAWGAVGLGVAIVVLAMGSEPATHIPYVNMIGGAAITLGLVGLVASFARPSPLGDLAVPLALVLFPLTAVDFFNSPFWPGRTVAYLAIAVALLSGVAAVTVQHHAKRMLVTRRSVAAPVAVAIALAVVGSAVAVAPGKMDSWYRLYDDDEFAAFETLAAEMNADDDLRVIVYSWQPGLILKALADPGQIRYAPDYYKDAAERADIVDESRATTLVLVDEFALEAEKKGKIDLSFVNEGHTLVRSDADDRFRLYEVSR